MSPGASSSSSSTGTGGSASRASTRAFWSCRSPCRCTCHTPRLARTTISSRTSTCDNSQAGRSANRYMPAHCPPPSRATSHHEPDDGWRPSDTNSAMPKPTNVGVVLLDSLNRHMLGSYGGTEFDDPEPRPVRRPSEPPASPTTSPARCRACRPATTSSAVRSTSSGSRWGSIELWERPVTADLTHAGVATQLVSDHPHLFETGGENYHTDFLGLGATCEATRATRGAPMPTRRGSARRRGRPARAAGSTRRRSGWRCPSGRTTGRARSSGPRRTSPGPGPCRPPRPGSREATPHHDRWFLFVDEFDPHEPFDTPEPWLGRYEDEPWDDEWIIWPPYVDGRGRPRATSPTPRDATSEPTTARSCR